MKTLLSIVKTPSMVFEIQKIYAMPKRYMGKLLSVSSLPFLRNGLCSLLTTFLILLPMAASSDHSRRDILSVIFPDGREQIYNLHDIEKMEHVEFISSSPWTEGQNLYSGVPLLDFMRSLGPNVSRIEITARNNYVIEFSIEDLTSDWPILATHIDGLPIPNRSKGPFWVVYPYDDVPDLRREDIYARSIWQVGSVKVK